MKPEINLTDIVDVYVRRNFEKIKEFFEKESPLDGFRAFEIQFTAPISNFKFKHNLGYQPKDVFISSKKGDGTVIFNYSSFTATDLDITVTGAVSTSNPTTIRILAGTIGGIK